MKVKVNEGHIYEIEYIVEGESGQVYSEFVYATCKAHAMQIFDSAKDKENCIVKNCEETDVCISQHYGNDERAVIPEHRLAEDIMYSALEEIMKDKAVAEENIGYVLDLAMTMIKKAVASAKKRK